MFNLTDQLGRATLLLSPFADLPVPHLFQLNGNEHNRITLTWSSRYDHDTQTALTGFRAVCAWADRWGVPLQHQAGLYVWAGIDLDGFRVTVRTDLFGEQRGELSVKHGITLMPDTDINPGWLLSIMNADKEMPNATLSCR